jgi:hypothetical protein
MGYACPVCETPQRDAEHLANHLAFTAMLHDDAHEAWLDEQAPGWAEAGADELAPVVAEAAPEAPYDEVFEERVPDRGGGHEHAHAPDHDRSLPPGGAASVSGDLDAEARQALAEAREMTRSMLAESEDDEDDEKA